MGNSIMSHPQTSLGETVKDLVETVRLLKDEVQQLRIEVIETQEELWKLKSRRS